MSFYRHLVLPQLLDLTMRQQRMLPYRERALSAEGIVVKVGVGSGLNLPLYERSAAGAIWIGRRMI